MKLLYSPQAIEDLRRLRRFIAEKDPSAAGRIGNDLANRIALLRSFPHAGMAVARAPDPQAIRDLIVGAYIVRYLVRSQAVIVLRVWHHNEDREGDH
jgi:plasmid stabilization system protein ParE